jgi:hypothetical protein
MQSVYDYTRQKVLKFLVPRLQALLGTYFEGIDENSTTVQVSKGVLLLENISFKRHAFAEMKIPIEIASGITQKLINLTMHRRLGQETSSLCELRTTSESRACHGNVGRRSHSPQATLSELHWRL